MVFSGEQENNKLLFFDNILLNGYLKGEEELSTFLVFVVTESRSLHFCIMSES